MAHRTQIIVVIPAPFSCFGDVVTPPVSSFSVDRLQRWGLRSPPQAFLSPPQGQNAGRFFSQNNLASCKFFPVLLGVFTYFQTSIPVSTLCHGFPPWGFPVAFSKVPHQLLSLFSPLGPLFPTPSGVPPSQPHIKHTQKFAP